MTHFKTKKHTQSLEWDFSHRFLKVKLNRVRGSLFSIRLFICSKNSGRLVRRDFPPPTPCLLPFNKPCLLKCSALLYIHSVNIKRLLHASVYQEVPCDTETLQSPEYRNYKHVPPRPAERRVLLSVIFFFDSIFTQN